MLSSLNVDNRYSTQLNRGKMYNQAKITKIENAMVEAVRFLNTAKDWKIRLKNVPGSQFGSIEGGACKRASMDLTRSLAVLRKPD